MDYENTMTVMHNITIQMITNNEVLWLKGQIRAPQLQNLMWKEGVPTGAFIYSPVYLQVTTF